MMIIFFSFQIMNSLILCLVILVSVMSGAISLGDANSYAIDDVRAAVNATPCCMLKGTSKFYSAIFITFLNTIKNVLY